MRGTDSHTLRLRVSDPLELACSSGGKIVLGIQQYRLIAATVAVAAGLLSGCTGKRLIVQWQDPPIPIESITKHVIPRPEIKEVAQNKTIEQVAATEVPTTATPMVPNIPSVPTPSIPQPNSMPLPLPGSSPAPLGGPTSSLPPISLPMFSANPHQRGTPTAMGAALNLGPNEQPLDRALDLVKRIEDLLAEKQQLVGRIKQLESQAETREQALAEAMREVETAAAEVLKTKLDMQALRKEVMLLQERVKAAEENELDTLRAVIMALEKLLQQP